MPFHIGRNCDIHPSVVINVQDGFLGDNAVIREGARIEGTRVEIGREAFLDRLATIGGGSCFDSGAFLRAGDWLHMGVSSHLNIARGVTTGHEFGCGIETKIFTHGAYIDAFGLGAPVQWAPVVIGDSVWLPNAWVNPGVTIGSNVVVAARSLINRDLPTGCLAGGVPAKILKERYLPRDFTREDREKLTQEIVAAAKARYLVGDRSAAADMCPTTFDDPLLICQNRGEKTVFDLEKKVIIGPASEWTLLLKDQLRRNGCRFRFKAVDGFFAEWSANPRQI